MDAASRLAGAGRDESNQGGKNRLHAFTSGVLELVEHESSQSLLNENKNGEPSWLAVHHTTMRLASRPGSLELRDQPRLVLRSQIVNQRIDLLQPTLAQRNAACFF
jgi:hypothetical protein